MPDLFVCGRAAESALFALFALATQPSHPRTSFDPAPPALSFQRQYQDSYPSFTSGQAPRLFSFSVRLVLPLALREGDRAPSSAHNNRPWPLLLVRSLPLPLTLDSNRPSALLPLFRFDRFLSCPHSPVEDSLPPNTSANSPSELPDVLDCRTARRPTPTTSLNPSRRPKRRARRPVSVESTLERSPRMGQPCPLSNLPRAPLQPSLPLPRALLCLPKWPPRPRPTSRQARL